MLASNVRYGEPSAFGIRLRVEQNAQPQAKTHAILQCPCPAKPASYSLVPMRGVPPVCAASFQREKKNVAAQSRVRARLPERSSSSTANGEC
jgi:hypothetical protein